MNILGINNFYYLRGGAESVFFSERDLINRKGIRFIPFSGRHRKNVSTEFDRFFPQEIQTDRVAFDRQGLKTLTRLFYSFESKHCLKNMLKSYHIDVAHAHNIYGRLTTSVLDGLREYGIPVVMTLHDYKIICPNYKMMHHGRICEDCHKHSYYNAMFNRCHKNSFIASTLYALETYFNFLLKKYEKNVTYFISPSLFLKLKMVEFGWPAERIEYIPNFISIDDFSPDFTPGRYFLYLGRLSNEKGISTLIKAFSRLNSDHVRLKIAGEGPLEGELRKIAAVDRRISFSGYLSGPALSDITRKALAVVVPSEWYENAPLSVLEAMAYGKPVIGARIGGIPEMIDDGTDGFLFEHGTVDALHARMESMLDMKNDTILEMGRAARKKIETVYNPERHYQKLMAIYQKAIDGGN